MPVRPHSEPRGSGSSQVEERSQVEAKEGEEDRQEDDQEEARKAKGFRRPYKPTAK